jgi:hypothetical protein
MNKRAILGKAIAAVALSAALAGVGVDTASARPTTGGLRDACTGAGGTWTMDGYVQDGRYRLLGYTCDLGGGGDMVYDSNGNYLGG